MDSQISEDGWTLVTHKKTKKFKPKYTINKIIDVDLPKHYYDDETGNDDDAQFPTPLHYKCKQNFT